MTSELDTAQFNNTPIIRKLKSHSESKVQQEEEKPEIIDSTKPKSNRGRKRKYNSAEERLAARRLQQKAYRERKKAELAALKAQSEQHGDTNQ